MEEEQHYEENLLNDVKIDPIRILIGEKEKHNPLINKFDQFSNKLKNPFKHIKTWIKDEMMSLESLMNAIAEKDNCEVRKAKAAK